MWTLHDLPASPALFVNRLPLGGPVMSWRLVQAVTLPSPCDRTQEEQGVENGGW